MKKRVFFYLSVLIVAALFLFTRLYKLTVLPSGVHIDEASMAYSSWCLANYGIDRYRNSWPIYIQNFVGGQSALYPYFLAFLFKFFDCTIAIIRTPAVVFSILTFVFGTLICRKMYPGQKMPIILCGLLMTICPYFILASRFGLDCNLMLGASTVFLFFFIEAIRTEKPIYYFVSGVLGGIVLYTYAMSYLILPAFLLFSIIYLIRVKKFNFSSWFIMGVPLFLLALPLLLEQYVNILDKPEIKLGIFTITKLGSNRAAEVGAFTFDKMLFALKSIFLYDRWIYNSVPKFYNLYSTTIIFFILGIHSYLHKFITSLKEKKINLYIFLLLWFLAVLFVESHIESNVNKINSIFYVTILISVEGILCMYRSFRKRISCVLLGIICTIYLLHFVSFGNYYYGGVYDVENNPLPFFSSIPTEAVAFIEENPACRDKVTYMAEDKVYYALASMDSPYELDFDMNTYYVNDNFYCASLPEISKDCNYIVREGYIDYVNSLREQGFIELKYEHYSLFYYE